MRLAVPLALRGDLDRTQEAGEQIRVALGGGEDPCRLAAVPGSRPSGGLTATRAIPGGGTLHRPRPFPRQASRLGAAGLKRLEGPPPYTHTTPLLGWNQRRKVRRASSQTREERWVNSIFSPVPKNPPVEDIWYEEKEEEEEEEEEEDEENEDKEKEKVETRIKVLLGAPRQDSVWGLMAWPRPSPEQARWWEDFSLPPLREPRLYQCRLGSKMRLHPLPPPKTLPSLASREKPSWLRNQPLMEPSLTSRLKIPKAVPRLPPKVSPKRSTVPKAQKQQTPMAMWPPITINTPSKSSVPKGQHTPAAKEASNAPGAWGNPLPHLPPK